MTPDLPDTIREFDEAQRRAIAMLRDVTQRLEAGMSERDITELAEGRLGDHGFDRWYHPPEVRVGSAIGGRSLRGASKRRRLETGGLVGIDLGPSTDRAYGDVGTTLCFGSADGEPSVVGVARECVRASCGYASRWKTVGEIFIFATAWAVNHRMELANGNAVGHRVLPREGLVANGFPRSAHLACVLAPNRIHRLNPVRMSGMFAIRPVVRHGETAASFEEIVYIHDDVRKVLGRDSLAEIAT